MYWGFLNERESPGTKITPLPLGAAFRKVLGRNLAEIFEHAGATAESVLTQYDDKVMWTVPPVYIGTWEDLDVTAEIQMAPHAFVNLYHSAVNAMVEGHGVTDHVLGFVKGYLGESYNAFFSISEPTPGYAAIITMVGEFALAGRQLGKTFMLGEEGILLEMEVPGIGLQYIGFRGNEIAGTTYKNGASQDDVAALLASVTTMRGGAIFRTFDIFDQLLLWANKNPDRFLDYERTTQVLALCKLAQSETFAYSMQQAVFKIGEGKAVGDVAMRDLLYTEAGLQMIRAAWDNQVEDQRTRLTNLWQILVPMYLDDNQFLDIFGILPRPEADWRISRKAWDRAILGMERFIRIFQRTQRAVAAGKDIRI